MTDPRPSPSTGYESIPDAHIGLVLQAKQKALAAAQRERDLVKREINRRERRERLGS